MASDCDTNDQALHALDLPTIRVIRIIETLALCGPMTYEDLREATQIPKTSVWRYVTSLRQMGWVETRQSARILELSHRIDEMLSQARFSDREFTGICPRLSSLRSEMKATADLYLMTRGGEITLFDTTRKILERKGKPLEHAEVVQAAIYSAMTLAQKEKTLADAKRRGALSEISLISDLAEAIVSLDGLVVLEQSRFILVARGSMGTAAAFVVQVDRKFSKRISAAKVAERMAQNLWDIGVLVGNAALKQSLA